MGSRSCISWLSSETRLGPAGVAHRIEIRVAAVDGQGSLVHLPGHDAHDHGQAFAGHGEEVLGLQDQALGRGIIHIPATLAGHGLHRGDGGKLVRGLKVHEFVAEQVFLAHGRSPGELFGDGGGRGDGVAAETVHYPGQDRNGRLVAVHQDVLAFSNIFQQLGGNGREVEAKKFSGVEPLPFCLPVDLFGGFHLALPEMMIRQFFSQAIEVPGET